jgi:hypothetical protein
MTKTEIDDERLTRSMRRLMEMRPPVLDETHTHAVRWTGKLGIGLGTLVVVAGIVAGSVVLRDRTQATPTHGSATPPATSVSPTPPALVPLPMWMSDCLMTAGITIDPPPAGMSPTLTPAEVVNAAQRHYLAFTQPFTIYDEFVIPVVGSGNPNRDTLTGPMWLLGLEINAVTTGSGSPALSSTTPPQPGIDRIYFVNDASETTVLSFDCPS